MELYETIRKVGGAQSKAMEKHLRAAGIEEWSDLTKSNIMAYRDELRATLSPSSAKTVGAATAALLHRFEEEGIIPCKSFSDILRLRGEQAVKTYLSAEDMVKFEAVETKSAYEECAKNAFLIGYKTGARLSDVRRLTPDNVQDGFLTYTSQKTKITSHVPCSEATKARLVWMCENRVDMDISTYNDIIRRLCQRAGINEVVKIHKGGKDIPGEKYKFISSHSARISIATNMSIAGARTHDIMQALGHTSEHMTEHYICKHEVSFNEQTLALLL